MVSARDLNIREGDDLTYWQWNPDSSVFPEVAVLIQPGYFDLRGAIDMADLSPNTMYAVRFLVKHTAKPNGWNRPIALSLEVNTDDDLLLDERDAFLCPIEVEESGLRPGKEFNGWMHVKVGEFMCEVKGGKVESRMCGRRRAAYEGIIFMGVEIRPCSEEETKESSNESEHDSGDQTRD